MLIEKIIFNLLAFTIFINIFFKVIKKNDNAYIVILILEALGILINFVEITLYINTHYLIKILIYIFSIIIPGLLIILEKNNINFIEYVYIYISKVYLFFNNTKKAKNILIKFVDNYPQNYVAHKMLAEIYEKEGGIRKSIDEYVKVVDINKKDYESYYKIAFYLNELEKKDESIEMLYKLVQKKPEYYKASELLGNLLCEKECFKDAISVYMNALKYNSTNYELYYNLGIAYTRLNDFKNAKMFYEKAAQLNSHLYNAYYNLGQISLIYDDIEEAEQFLNKSIEDKTVEAKSYYYLARIYIMKGEKEKAINYLNLAIELDNQLSKKALKDDIFILIQKYIYTPKQKNEIDEENIKIDIKDRKVQEYLENTYYLIRKLNKNDIIKMHSLENQNINIYEEKERED